MSGSGLWYSSILRAGGGHLCSSTWPAVNAQWQAWTPVNTYNVYCLLDRIYHHQVVIQSHVKHYQRVQMACIELEHDTENFFL